MIGFVMLLIHRGKMQIIYQKINALLSEKEELNILLRLIQVAI
jgi:hypothetical protein